MRKEGTLFDARMYISPLIDPKGQQTGWMTSMTNITEAKRIRDQLRPARTLHHRAGGAGCLGVGAVGAAGELLFANRSYRLWFGGDARGHQQMGGAAAWPNSHPKPTRTWTPVRPAHARTHRDRRQPARGLRGVAAEVVRRARALPAVDRRPPGADADRHRHHRALRAEEQTAAQAEKAQVTSRLVTMGEMASSVAHELNQPLTAITNYCNGMVSRVKADSIAQGRSRRRTCRRPPARPNAPGRSSTASAPS
jgi:hypothetical protein